VARVRTILRRTERAPDDSPAAVYVLGGLELDAARHRVTVGGREVPLSSLELRLLQVLLEADGRVLSRDRLLDALYGHAEGDVTDRAIDVYVKRLREKLGDDPDAPRYVATVRGAGYRAAGPVERRNERRGAPS
jgi:DNA-binding response OmpR family regulator